MGEVPLILPSMSKLTTQLLSDIERFNARYGISDTTFGKMSVNDGHLVHEIRKGRDLRASQIERIRAFMVDYRPLGSKRRAESRPAA